MYRIRFDAPKSKEKMDKYSKQEFGTYFLILVVVMLYSVYPKTKIKQVCVNNKDM